MKGTIFFVTVTEMTRIYKTFSFCTLSGNAKVHEKDNLFSCIGYSDVFTSQVTLSLSPGFLIDISPSKHLSGQHNRIPDP